MVSDFKYTKQDGHGTIALGTDFPAKILRFSLDEYPNAKLVCQKGAYLAGSHSVAMEMAYTKNFSSGFFGGEGFILQSLQATNVDGSGDETVFLKAYGTVVKKDLKEGETLRVSSGSLVCMTSDIDYDVSMMPGECSVVMSSSTCGHRLLLFLTPTLHLSFIGFKNVMFGGEGLFVTTLTGPGSVWLQGMPVDRMVSEIARHIPSGGGIGLGIPIGMGGGGGGGEGAAGDMAVGEAAGELAAEGGEGDSGVPLTEDAVDADRNATVASSGIESSSDPESSESLFGDAAFGGEQTDTASSGRTNEDSFSSTSDDFSSSEDNMIIPEFEEPTMTEDQFEDDGTTFSTYDEGSESAAGDTEGVDMPNDEEGSSLLGQLWDIFRDFTDDD